MLRFFSSFLTGAALLLSLVPTKAATAARPDDTIQVRLSDGASMTLYVRNQDELRKLRTYKMDSLLALLDRYITQAHAMSKMAGDAARTTMEFHPSRDLKNPAAPETLRVVVYNDKNHRSESTSTTVMLGGRTMRVNVDVDDNDDDDDDKGHHHHTSVRVNSNDDSLNEVRHQRYDEEHTHSSMVLGFGLNALTNTKNIRAAEGGQVPLDLRTWGSRYVHLGFLADTRFGQNPRSAAFVRYGFQFAFNNYMLDKNRQWVDRNDTTFLTTVPTEERSLRKSKLTTSVIQVPVLLGLKFHNKRGKQSVTLAAGGFAGYRLGAHTKLKYEQDGDTKKPKDHGSFNLEDFQYGLTSSLSIFGHELFATYNLNELFRKDRGPQANVLTFGVTLIGNDGDFKSHKYSN